ncbi:GntR family transcriptional regulator [Microbispora sp. NPDC004025]
MPVDPDSYTPAYRQIADDLRDRIARGQLPPGRKLPAEDRLADEYGVGKDTLRDALAQLRSEGLIRTVHRVGSYVREQTEPEVTRIEGPAQVRARMPTPEERRLWRLDDGIPVLVVDSGGRQEILPADRAVLDIPPHR